MKKLLIFLPALILLALLPGSLAEAAPMRYNSLNNGLVAFWKLDEESGTRYDSVGNNHLTDNNTVGRSAGVVGEAARFVSSNSEDLSISDNADMSPTGDFTIAGWFYFDDPSNTQTRLISKYTGAPSVSYHLSLYSTVAFAVYDDSSYTGYGVYSGYSSGWNFIVAWVDTGSDTINLSVNGNTNGAAFTGNVNDSSAPFKIGSLNSQYSDIRVDAVGFWHRVLSPAERTLLYNNGNGMEYPFLEPTATPTSTSTPTGTRTPTATATATSTSSGQCSDCWNSPTPVTPTAPISGTTTPQNPYVPTVVTIQKPGGGLQPTAIPVANLPVPSVIDPQPVPTPNVISPTLISTPQPVSPTISISLTNVISPSFYIATPVSSTVVLSYSTPAALSAGGTVSGTTSFTSPGTAAYTDVVGIIVTTNGWIGEAVSYTGWLSGEVATLQATQTFTIATAPSWYAKDLPRPMANVGYTFDLMRADVDNQIRYSLSQWAWLGGYIVSLPIQLVKVLYQIVQFLGPLGLLLTWLLVMLPFVLVIKFLVFIQNLIISLLNFILKGFRFILDIIKLFL
jgi:hypothetical protein